MFTLSEALDAVKDKQEFSVNKRTFGTVIDYNVIFEGSFKGNTARETLILQNLRGTCFNCDGKITRLAYHKFHNLNENPDYHESKFNLAMPHRVEEKLDGSMVTPILLGDGVWMFGTRAGVTDVAVKAQTLWESWKSTNWVKYEAYRVLIEDCVEFGFTPIFEFCSREQRIVIDYPTANLVLTDIRVNATGAYLANDIVDRLARDFVDRVREVANEKTSLGELARAVRDIKGQEGVVVKFQNGTYIKIKGDDYCLKHRALDGLRFEKDVLALVLKNELDDVLPLVADDVKARLIAYRDSVWWNLGIEERIMNIMFASISPKCESKKDFALAISGEINAKFLFKLYDGKSLELKEYVLSKCGTQTSVDSVRWLIGPSYLEF